MNFRILLHLKRIFKVMTWLKGIVSMNEIPIVLFSVWLPVNFSANLLAITFHCVGKLEE